MTAAITMNRTKRPRVELKVAQKLEICRYYEKNPTFTIKDLQHHFSNTFGLPIGHSTIGNILKRAEHWNSIEFPDNERRTHSTRFANMEKEVFDWICSSSEPVLDDEIMEKVKKLVEDSEIQSEWNTTRGWLNSFKRRFNLIVRLDNDSKPIGYIASKMPAKREPLRRVKASVGRKPSNNMSKYIAEVATSNTNSIIYDAALGNFLQDHDDDQDDHDNLDTVDNSSGVLEMVDKPASPSKTRLAESTPGINTNRPSKELPITHKVIFERISEAVSTSQPSKNSVPTSSAYTCPVVFRSTEAPPTVHVSSAQKALSTLASFFEQNLSTCEEDLEHLKALDFRLKYLSAKEAVETLKAHLKARDSPKDEADVQYLTGLEQRL